MLKLLPNSSMALPVLGPLRYHGRDFFHFLFLVSLPFTSPPLFLPPLLSISLYSSLESALPFNNPFFTSPLLILATPLILQASRVALRLCQPLYTEYTAFLIFLYALHAARLVSFISLTLLSTLRSVKKKKGNNKTLLQAKHRSVQFVSKSYQN